MPCRILDYLDAYARWNAFSSLESYVFLIGIFCFFVVVFSYFNQWKQVCSKSLGCWTKFNDTRMDGQKPSSFLGILRTSNYQRKHLDVLEDSVI